MAVGEEIIGAALGRKCNKVHSYGKLSPGYASPGAPSDDER